MKKKTLIVGALGLTIASIVGASVAAFAAPPATTGSDAPYYLVDLGTGEEIPAGTTNAWTADISGSPVGDNTSFTERVVGPAGTTDIWSFIAPRGSEKNKGLWNASLYQIHDDDVLLPSASPYGFVINNGAQNPGSANGVRATGGDYSLGVAFLDASGAVIGADFTFIEVTPVTGAWTFSTPAGTVTPPPAGTSFTSNLSATAVAAADGALSLVAPTNLDVVIGNPTLTNGTYGQSVSTGTLGQFSVQDNRFVTHTGWSLTTSVQDFAGAVSVPKAQLGVKPILVTAGTTAEGVTSGAEQIAGSAVYPSTFASAVSNPTVGTTNFNADLRFVAPANAPAGVYTSTLTLTVVGN